MGKISDERNTLKREIETKNQELQEKMRTVTQVKKIGRRYKTQYDELKVEHDKVRTLYLYLLTLTVFIFNPVLEIKCTWLYFVFQFWMKSKATCIVLIWA